MEDTGIAVVCDGDGVELGSITLMTGLPAGLAGGVGCCPGRMAQMGLAVLVTSVTVPGMTLGVAVLPGASGGAVVVTVW
jgi:hypothetical protein